MQLSLPAPRKHLISLTPLIDVVFILLLFFMLSSNFVPWKHMEIVLPSQKAGKNSDSTKDVLSLKVMPDSQFMLKGIVYSNLELERQIASHLKQNPGSHIIIEPYGNALLQNIVDIFDRLKRIELTNVTLGKVVSP